MAEFPTGPVSPGTGTISALVATGQNVVVALNEAITALSNIATQVSSLSNVTVFYDTGSWIPDVTFATSGDAVFTYTTQIGRYTKIGGLVFVFFDVSGSLTYSSSITSGVLRINGLPFFVGGSMASYQGSFDFNTIIPSTNGYTHFVPEALVNTSRIQIIMNNNVGISGRAFVTSTSISTTAVGIVWRGTIPYVSA